MLSGAVQPTVRLDAAVDVTDSEVGLFGGSATSVTVTLIVCDAVITRSPVPDDAVTTTTCSLLPAIFDGVVLITSPGDSKSGAESNVNTPPAVIENSPESAPDSV